MPSISTPGPAASWTESRPNYAGGEFGKSMIPSFGRSLDGDLAVSTTYPVTSRRRGAACHGSGYITPQNLSLISVVAPLDIGTPAAGHYVAIAGVPDGTTVTSYTAPVTLTCTTTAGSGLLSAISSTANLSVGQCLSVGGSLVVITVVNSGTTVTVTPNLSGNASGVTLTSLGAIKLSAPSSQSWGFSNSGNVSFATSTTNTLASRSADAAMASVTSIDATNTILQVTQPGTSGGSRLGGLFDYQVGDTCLMLNQQGSTSFAGNVGSWELCKIASINNSGGPTGTISITLVDPLTRLYGATNNTALTGQVVVLARVPEYGNVTVSTGGVLTMDPWSGYAGGLLCVMAQSLTCSGTGKIVGDALGYRAAGAAGYSGEGNMGGAFSGASLNAVGSGGGGGAVANSAPPSAAGTSGGYSPVVPASTTSQSGGGSGGAGGPGGGAGGGGGYNTPGTPGGLSPKGGGGGAGGPASPTGVGTSGGVGGNPTTGGAGVSPSPFSPAPYGANSAGGSAYAAPGVAAGGGSLGATSMPQILMGGAGGSVGSGFAGSAGGAAWPAPPTTPPANAPFSIGSNGGAGGSGGGFSPGSGGGNGAGAVMLFAKACASINISCLGQAGANTSPSGSGASGLSGGSPTTATSPPASAGAGYVGAGGAGGGGGGAGGSGSGASGSIYIYCQTLTTVNSLNVSPVAGGTGSPGGAGGLPPPSAPGSNAGGAGLAGAPGGAGAAGRIKVVYSTQDGVYAAASADGAGLFPTTPSSPTPVGYKQTL